MPTSEGGQVAQGPELTKSMAASENRHLGPRAVVGAHLRHQGQLLAAILVALLLVVAVLVRVP